MKKTVLVIASHYDDEVIGCGGTIISLISKGYDVNIQQVFNGSSGIENVSYEESIKIRRKEALSAATIGKYTVLPNLGFDDRQANDPMLIARKLISVFRKINPQIVFVPHDEEQDYEHQVVAKSSWEACWLSSTSNFLSETEKAADPVEVYLGYEVWKPIQRVSTFYDITKHVDQKKELLSAFTTQMDATSWIQGSLGLNAYRGSMLQGSGYAEAFTLRNLGTKSLDKLL